MARTPLPPPTQAAVKSTRPAKPGEENTQHTVWTDPVTGKEIAACPSNLAASIAATDAAVSDVLRQAEDARAARAAS